MTEELKTSNEWYTILFPNNEVKILDPDGWDRTNYQYSWYEECIAESEFKMRVLKSTVCGNISAITHGIIK